MPALRPGLDELAMDDQPSTLWTLVQGDDQVSCQVRLMPYGIDVDIAANGKVMLTRTFATDSEALAWADQKRAAREARGWRPASAGDTHA